MDSGHVEGVVAAANAEEPGSLFERLRTHTGHGHELDARAKPAVVVPVFDDLFRRSLIDAGDVAQQRPRGSVEINADAVNTAFDSRAERLIEPPLVDIVLVLADADRLRIDFHQLRQRVLQTAGNGNGAAHGEVEIRELLAGQIGSGVDGSAGFVHGDRKYAFGLLATEKIAPSLSATAPLLARPKASCARSGAVADSDGAH